MISGRHEISKSGNIITENKYSKIISARLNYDDMDYIKEYHDYIDNCGVGYILTNGTIGFYYNDLASIIWNKKYGYIDLKDNKSKVEVVYLTENDMVKNPEIKIKLKIIKMFIEYLQKKDKDNESSLKLPNILLNREAIFVKQVSKAKHGIMFYLSNNILQMFFFDKTQIVFNITTNSIIHIEKNGEKDQMKYIDNITTTTGRYIIKKVKYALKTYEIENTRLSSSHVVSRSKLSSSNYIKFC